MPYVSAARLNPSASTPSLHILASVSRLSLDHSVGVKPFTVLPPRCRAQCETTNAARMPNAITSAVGRPIKSSLKRSSSWGHRGDPTSAVPSMSRNTLSPSRKCVRFRAINDRLESVCFFRATGRPAAILNTQSDSEIESETISTDDDARLFAQPCASLAPPTVPFESADMLSQIPSPHTPLTSHTNVRLESLSPVTARFGQGQGQGQEQSLLLLRGIVRVRNISYEKCVAVRYTLDNWITVSEACARYVGPFAPAQAATPTSGDGEWDRFAFTIPLDGRRVPLGAPPRTLLLAVRFASPGAGEWWDNNGGENFGVMLVPSLHMRRLYTQR